MFPTRRSLLLRGLDAVRYLNNLDKNEVSGVADTDAKYVDAYASGPLYDGSNSREST